VTTIAARGAERNSFARWSPRPGAFSVTAHSAFRPFGIDWTERTAAVVDRDAAGEVPMRDKLGVAACATEDPETP
jgi:hypothetical protein